MRERWNKALPWLVLGFCVLQPLLDVLSYWQLVLGLPNVATLILRVLLLGLMLLGGFLLSKKKWAYRVVLGLLLLFLGGHVLACVQAGYENPAEDLSEQLRIFMGPLTALCFITFFRRDPRIFQKWKLALVLDLGLILLVEVLATVTGTDPHTYPNKSIGVLGWFYWANAQSAILSMLVPIAVTWVLERWKRRLLPTVLAALAGLGMLFFMATRLSYMAMLATGFGLSMCLLLADRTRWKQSLILALCAVLFLGLYPVSPLKRNQEAIGENAVFKQEEIDQVLTEAGYDPAQGRCEDLAVLEKAYEKYLQGVVDRFGIQRVAEALDYTTDIAVVGDRRGRQALFCRLLLEDSPALSNWFGLELGRMRQDTRTWDFYAQTWTQTTEALDVDDDVVGVRYLSGWVGLGLLALGLLAVLGKALWGLIRGFKVRFTPNFAALAIACCCGLAHGLFTISVIRRNNASVYFGMALAALWVLSELPTSTKERQSL